MRKGYALCLNEWIEDERITNELALLLKISSLTAKDGHCFANNSYFSNIFKKTEVSISRKIKKLESFGYIEISYEKRGCEVTKRKIRLSKMLIDDYQKKQSTIIKNVKDNNTSINNTSINNNPLTPFQGELQGIEIQSFWNKYKSVPNGIRARNITAEKKLLPECKRWTVDLEEIYKKIKNKGYSEEEIKQAIKNYCNDIINRDPKTSYSEHRFSIMEFLKQSNGFLNYINK